jgi:quinol-cytochrome oxidoreductase complex cytochrome b subunit
MLRPTDEREGLTTGMSGGQDKTGSDRPTPAALSPATSAAPPRGMPGDPAPGTPEAPAAKKPSGFANLLLHLHPKMVPEDALAIERTFGLGGMALILFLVLIATGALLLFAYEPSTERAYASVASIQEEVPFGAFVRGIHHWAGNFLLVVAFLHLLRVFFTGAFLPPRRFNWGLGLAMILIVMAGNFTGYLLPWDQLAYWAVTIGTGMLQYVPLAGDALQHMTRGGDEVGPKTLSLFFVLHIALLPILLFLLTGFHFWLVRKAGGVMLPGASSRGGAQRPTLVPARPNLVLREGVTALALLAVLLATAAVAMAPLEEQANPGMSPNPAKAPWYFMGIQELLVHLHPSFAVLVVPLLVITFLAGLPFFRYAETPTGSWFHSARGKRAALMAAAAALVIVPAAVLLDEHILKWTRLFPALPAAISAGLVPLALWGTVVLALVLLLKRSLSLSRLETVQSLFAFVTVAFLVLTVVGVLFRGPGMRLVWPW